MAEKPTAAFVLSLLAGIFILINGLVIAAIGAFIAVFLPGLGIALAAIGLVFGIIVLIGAFMLNSNPQAHTMWGVLILVFSILSLVIGGGFFLGFILGLIGGILAIVWKPAPAMGVPMGVQPGQAMPAAAAHCTQCGAPLAPGAMRCASCGAPVR